ncbi:D-isomer specific 2-hydroxyacid dehydrogenase, catalytic domain protein, partial [Vibrio parahaemolyticus IDH02640]
LCLSM